MALTKREAAIITMYTGVLLGEFSDAASYAEEILGRPIFTHEYPALAEEIKIAAKPDFVALEIN